MNIKGTLKQSFFMSFLLKLKKIADNSFLFDYSSRKTYDEKKYAYQNYSTWMDVSIFYRFFKFLDYLLRKFQKFLHRGVIWSKLLSPVTKVKTSKDYNSYIIKFVLYVLHKFSRLLILVPVGYIVIDYLIRRMGFLFSLASIWDELMLLIFVCYYIYKGIKENGEIKFNFTPMDLPILIYIILGMSHAFMIGANFGIAIEGFRAVFQHVLWYFVATQFIRSIEESNRIINFFMGLGLFLGVHSVYQYMAKVPMPKNWVDISENIQIRAFSIVGSPNILGAIFVLLIPIGISMVFTKKGKSKTIFYIMTVLFMTAGLLLTMSRGSWLAIAFAMFIYILLIKPKLMVPFVGVLGLFIVFGGSLSERLLFMLSPTYLLRSAAGGRLHRWQIGLELWMDHKFFGVGLGRFGGAVAMNNGFSPFYLDNYYLKTLTEMGIYGVAAMAFVILCFVVFAIKIIKKQISSKHKIVTIGLFSGCVGVLAQNFVENIFEYPALVVYFWIAVALINTFAPEGKFRKEN